METLFLVVFCLDFVAFIGGMVFLPSLWSMFEVRHKVGVASIIIVLAIATVWLGKEEARIGAAQSQALIAKLEAHNAANCVVKVEGQEFRPLRVWIRNGTGWMTLADGQKIHFLGGLIGGGCK
ncbi:MAG: hypothetical protein V4690_02420 [Patescibacteria group bacterium]